MANVMNDWKTWVLGALFTLFVMVGGIAFTSLTKQDDAIAAALAANNTIQTSNRERIAHLESAIQSQSEQLTRIERSLDALTRMHIRQQ